MKDTSWRSGYLDTLEIQSHLRELEPLDDWRVLELACGEGYYHTRLLPAFR
jgi:hypothetical protein